MMMWIALTLLHLRVYFYTNKKANSEYLLRPEMQKTKYIVKNCGDAIDRMALLSGALRTASAFSQTASRLPNIHELFYFICNLCCHFSLGQSAILHFGLHFVTNVQEYCACNSLFIQKHTKLVDIRNYLAKFIGWCAVSKIKRNNFKWISICTHRIAIH